MLTNRIRSKNIYVASFMALAIQMLASKGIGQDSNIPDAWLEGGLPHVRNYTPKEYGGFTQNWSVLQDQRGFIYTANNDGLLEYDGVNWRRFEDDGNLRAIRSLAIDSSGVIYVGTARDFGYIVSDSLQGFRLRSLLSEVNQVYREFNDVWSTQVLDNAVYFMTPNYLFRWSNERVDVIHPKTRFHTAFVVGRQLYVRQFEMGLTMLVGDSLRIVPGGEFFSDKRIYFIDQRDDEILIGTDEHGFFLYDGQSVRPFPISADKLSKESRLYCGVRLEGGYYVFGTRLGGLYIIDHSGNVVQHINTSNGLNDDSVWFIHVDHQGGLWLALNNGIARVETPAPFTLFDKRTGLEGTVEKVHRYNDILYAATSVGVQYLDVDTGDGIPAARFRPVSGLDEYSWTFVTVGTQLLACSTAGIHLIENLTGSKIHGSWSSVFSLAQSAHDPDRIYVGHRDGVGVLEKRSGHWQACGDLDNLPEKVFHVVEEDSNLLWLEAEKSGVIRAQIWQGERAASPRIATRITHFDTSDGLPNARIYPLIIHGEIRFITGRGIWKFDRQTEQFYQDNAINLTGHWGFLGVEDARGQLWLSHADKYGDPEQIGFCTPGDSGSYEWHPEPFFRLRDIAYVNNIYPEQSGVAWFSTSEGLIRHVPGFNKDISEKYGCFIRRVILNEDSTVFHGNESPPSPTLGYEDNTVRFEFAAPTFDATTATRYQYKLEGFREQWSEWGNETKKEYTNLTEGRYHFKVRAQNVHGYVSDEGSFSFLVLPPWYRSWWAYLLYILAFTSVLFIFRHYEMNRMARREQEKAKLREAEIVGQKNVELQEKNQELEFVLQQLQSAQNSLIDSESRFRAVAESANDAIITSDIKGNIIFWNKHAEAIFGYAVHEAVGQPLTMLMPEKHREAHREGLGRFLKTGKGNVIGRVVELEARRKDGTEFPIELTLASWETHNTKFVSGIIRDITERKQQQVDLEKTQVQLFQAEKMASLGKLTAGIAHEINTPLAAIKSNADVADRCVARLADIFQKRDTSSGIPGDNYQKFVNVLKENNRISLNASDRIAQILRSLKNFTRLDEADFQKVDLHQSIESVLSLLRHEISNEISVVKQFDDIPLIGCYPGEINQVLMNLLKNAAQAIEGKGTLTVRTLLEDGDVHVQITDTGIGIAPERRKGLFDPAFATKDSRVKTGLGLYTSHLLVQKHQGQIKVESEPGKGSRFTVILPVDKLN